MKIDQTKVYGIYVHIPFCLQKCAYCDFTSYPGELSRADCYLEALKKEMSYYQGISADTVYIGGGTPTCLSKDQLCGLVDTIKSHFLLTKDCEITVECNPKTADEAYFSALFLQGVNRLSIGTQSFCDKELSMLGRVHNAEEAKQCVQMAKNAGFTNINLDLMFGLPGQSMASFMPSVSELISLAPTHISAYSLILEEDTPLYSRVDSGELVLPDEDVERSMYRVLVDELSKAGYQQYEISNFSLPDFESRHNNKYWERAPYIGLGAAAHSHIGMLRFANPDELDRYIKTAKLPPAEGRETEFLTEKDAMSEFMFLGLRKMRGVSQKQFYESFGKPMTEVFSEPIQKYCQRNLLEWKDDHLCLTNRGIDVSNSVFCEFLLD